MDIGQFKNFMKDSGSSSLVGAGNNLLQGGIGQIFAGINARRNYKFQQRAAEEDLRRSKDFYKYTYDYSFDKQAAYNNPAAVRARMAAAGINPFATGLDPAAGGSADASPATGGISSGTASFGSHQSQPIDPLTAAQSRLANAQAKKIENETPTHEDFLDRYTKETRSVDLGNVGKDLANKIAEWDEKFKEVLKGLEVSQESARLDNLYAEYRRLLADTVNAWDTHGRNPLVREKLNRELGLMALQGGLIIAQTGNYSYRNLQLFSSAMESYQNTMNMQEVFRRLRMENLTLDQESSLRRAEFEWQQWEFQRGRNSGFGKSMYRVGQFTGALGNVFSGHAGYYSSPSKGATKIFSNGFKR